MKLSDFLKQQGDTPQGKSTYQAFIDNFDEDYDAKSFRKDEKGSIENGSFVYVPLGVMKKEHQTALFSTLL